MSMRLPPNLRLKNFPPEQIDQWELYEWLMTWSTLQFAVGPEQSVGVLLDMSHSKTLEYAVVTNKEHYAAFGQDLIFEFVVGDLNADRWAAVFQQNEEKVITGVVFANVAGMRIEISQAGEIGWYCKNIKLSNHFKPTKTATLHAVT